MFLVHVSSASGQMPAVPATARTPSRRELRPFDGVVVFADEDVSLVVDGRLMVIVAGAGRRRTEFADRDAAARRVAEGYRAKGVDGLDAIPSETAVAVFDADRRRTVLATDRFATYPLNYRSGPDGFAFSDRADALASVGSPHDDQALLDYLYYHVIPSPRTIHRGVTRVAGGSRLVHENGRTDAGRWWTPAFVESGPRVSFDALRTEFLAVLESAVARRAEGEVGCFLSGGTDSSTVAGMLGKVTGKPPRSYSMGFDADGYDEMEYARIAAEAYGADHRVYYMTPDDLLAAIPKVARHYDQPFGNSSAAAGFICASRAQADGLDLLLAGDGGDELFGGNSRYAMQRLFHVYGSVPGPLRAVLERTFTDSPLRRAPLIRKIGGYIEYARIPLPDRLQHYNLLMHLGIQNVLTPEFLSRIDVGALQREQARTFADTRAETLLNRMLAFDWKYTLEDNDLPKVVGTTALAGIDVAFPLLDDALVDFSLRLAPGLKLKGVKLRWFFKEALRGFLPDRIITKKKHGFGMPFGVWATRHRGLMDFAGDSLMRLKGRGIVRGEFIDELLSRRLAEHPGFYGEAVWILMMLEQWLSRDAGSSGSAPRAPGSAEAPRPAVVQ